MHKYNHRPDLPDDRDLLVPAPNPVGVNALPGHYDLWEHYPEIARWDQGQEGSCGGHAAARAMQKLATDNGETFDQPHPSDEADAGNDRVAPAFQYYVAREVMGTTDQDSGVDNRSLFKAAATYGYVHEQEMPYVAGNYAQAPSQQAYDAGKPHAGTTYRKLVPGHGSMRVQLASGNPIVGGFNVPDYFEDPNIWDPATQPLRLPRETPGFQKYLGGHDVCFTGYDYDRTWFPEPVFLIDNSWGLDWGAAFGAPSGAKGRFAISARAVSLFFDLWIVTKEA